MPNKWRDPAAFRADPRAAPALLPSRRQAIALVGVLVAVAAAVVVASYAIRPEKARAFDLFHGSVFLADQNSPVAVDLASGKPTLRLLGADKQVGITGNQQLGVVPLVDHTLLLNEATGEFNIVDNSGFVVKRNGGVPLVKRAGSSSSMGIPADDGQAYIVRTGPTGGTDVYLVDQATVESAISAVSSVRPRASTSMSGAGGTAAGSAASADGNLWLLLRDAGDSSRRTIRELQVPNGSSAGAALVSADHGTVTGAAALGTATSAADGTGSSVVALASPGRIRIFGTASSPRTAGFHAPAGVDTVLPASNASGRLAFLLHGSAGWYVVSVSTDGSGVRGPARLAHVPGAARLAAPAASGDRLYTLDQQDGRLFEIGYDGAVDSPGRDTYPLATLHGRTAEATDFADGYVFARGPRVVINSPSHINALMVFTDGSHKPLTIAKNSAVTVSASGGAEALTKADVAPGVGKSTGPAKTTPKDVQPINTKIDCKTVTQKPHVPVITSAVPGSRTVALTWSYPVFDVQDCYPSTYLVSVKLISNGAPQPPSSVRVQSQTGATISGLFPSTQYDVTVTAYINGQGTASQPVRIATGKEGPAAPTGLAVRTDSAGNWTVSFDSCGAIAQGCVPAQSWTITPNYCDGRGVSVPPSPITVTADPTSRAQPPALYRGSDDTLGRGLQFQVQGTGDEGQAGAPSAKSACVYSWTPPVASAIHVHASTPPTTGSSQQASTTTVSVTFDDGAVHDLGGVGATLTYQLLRAGVVVPGATVGPTTRPTATLHGVLPGQNYEVQVQASPPRHSEAVTTIGPVPVEPAIADWPPPLLDEPTFDAPAGLTGTLHVRFTFPAGTDVGGETFDLVNSQLTCGNTAMSLNATDVAPGDVMSFPVDRATYNGSCSVTIQLVQNASTATDPPLYGAGASKAVTVDQVQIDPPSSTSTASDFSAQWGGPTDQPEVIVSYHGSDDLPDGARNWRMVVSNGSGSCGEDDDNPPPATIEVDKSCIKQGGTFSVSIDYTYFLIAHAHFDVPITGTAPGPVDPTKISFTAAWNTTPALPQVDLTYTGTQDLASVAALNFTETVTSSSAPGVTCGSDTDNPADAPPRINVDLTACPPTATDGKAAVYTVEISFTDPNYGQTGDYTYVVQGTPPS